MIVLSGITKIYPTRRGMHAVLDDIDLTIQPGEKIGIPGRNGAGKSTLIRLLSGAERPTKCQVELFEKRKDRAFVMVSHEAHNIRNY